MRSGSSARWAELQERAEALRSGHGTLLLQEERDLLDKVTKARLHASMGRRNTTEVEKEIVVAVQRVKTSAA